MSRFITRKGEPLHPDIEKHTLTSLLLVLAATLLLSACSNGYAWVRKDNMDWMQQQVQAQHAEKQELIAQQAQFVDVMQRLNATLEQNQHLAQSVDRLGQTLARPLKLDTTTLRVVQVASAEPAKSDKSSGSAPAPDDKKMLVGAVEDVWFPQLKRKVESRIDTGAQSSSLNVASYEIIERDGDKWVRFSLDEDESADKDEDKKKKDENSKDDDEKKSEESSDEKPKTYEYKLVRHVKILQSSTEEKERRPVVKLRVVIGSVTQEVDFTLADRGHLSYPALIGRNALRDLMIVDVSKSHITKLPKDLED